MKIRHAQLADIPQLVAIDRAAYGSYGGNQDYFEKQFQRFSDEIFVVEESGRVTGFAVAEILEQTEMTHNFKNLQLKQPLLGRWLYIIAFTTATNYQDVSSDTQLVRALEQLAKIHGCSSVLVPLTKEHP